MSLHRGCLPWQKLTQKVAKLTHACRQTVAGLLFDFVDHGAGIRRATYLCLDCTKNVDKNWNITVSFIIYVNFDHTWAEHYPVTLRSTNREKVQRIILATFRVSDMFLKCTSSMFSRSKISRHDGRAWFWKGLQPHQSI